MAELRRHESGNAGLYTGCDEKGLQGIVSTMASTDDKICWWGKC